MDTGVCLLSSNTYITYTATQTVAPVNFCGSGVLRCVSHLPAEKTLLVVITTIHTLARKIKGYYYRGCKSISKKGVAR